MRDKIKQALLDILWVFIAGIVVGVAYFFFQNSNGFAPGGVGGLATITRYLIKRGVNSEFMDTNLAWALFMLAFNLPIFILVSIFVNRKLGVILSLYMVVQTGTTILLELWGCKAYCKANNGEDFEIVFACIATGLISGAGFSLMFRRFGASGGTYAISALIKKVKPNIVKRAPKTRESITKAERNEDLTLEDGNDEKTGRQHLSTT